MPLMSVTRDVSQLEMAVLKKCKPEKSQLMSVMRETSQSAMGPYVASAEATSSTYVRTAVCRATLVVKT